MEFGIPVIAWHNDFCAYFYMNQFEGIEVEQKKNKLLCYFCNIKKLRLCHFGKKFKFIINACFPAKNMVSTCGLLKFHQYFPQKILASWSLWFVLFCFYNQFEIFRKCRNIWVINNDYSVSRKWLFYNTKKSVGRIRMI